MRKLVLYIVVGLLSFNLCCQKTIDKWKEDLVIQSMTDGQWIVSRFMKGNADITPDFSEYKFQFKKDKTVDAIKSGIIEQSGTWSGNALSQTMSSNFLNGSHPVFLLNGTWNITNNSWTFVEASQNVNSELRTIRLDKK